MKFHLQDPLNNGNILFLDTVSHIWLKTPDFKRNMLENLFFFIISSYLLKDSIFINKTIVSWLLGKTIYSAVVKLGPPSGPLSELQIQVWN